MAAGEGLEGTASAGEQDVLEDPVLQPFLSEGFKHNEYASAVLRNPKVVASERTQMLQSSIAKLDAGIRAEVTVKQDALLGHARQLQVSDRSLQGIKGTITSFYEDLKQLKNEAQAPYMVLAQRSTELNNLHTTLQLLRSVNTRLKQTTKLQQVMRSGEKIEPMDLAKAAKLLWEIETAAEATDFSGVTVVEQTRELVDSSKSRVVKAAHELLTSGLKSQSQADVASALQAFFNLNTLRQVCLGTVESYASDLGVALKAATDSRQLGGLVGQVGAKGAAGKGAVRVQEALWQELDSCMKLLHSTVVLVWHLQRVLNKKRDPLTLASFVDVVQGQPDNLGVTTPRNETGAATGIVTLMDTFWSYTASAFTAAVQQAVSRGGAVRDSLVHSFPRLLALIESTLDKCVRETDVPGVSTSISVVNRQALMHALQPLQESFLAASLARMQQAVSGLYAPGNARTLPSAVTQCVGTLHEELKASLKSPTLAALEAMAVSRALATLCARASAVVASGAEARDISGDATPPQQRNIIVCSQLHEVHRALLAQVPKLPPAAAEVLCDALEHVQTHAVEAVLPLFKAVSEEAEKCILNMHSIDWAPAWEESVVQTSTYMRSLAELLQGFRSRYLSHFVPQPSPSVVSFAVLLCQRLASRIIAFFVRHAAMISVLSQAGKLQLAKDISELEQLLRLSIFPPDLLRQPHMLLRGFRSLLFLENSALVGAPSVSSLPPATVLLHMFSRLPADVKMPHERTSVTPGQFSKWMDQHTPKETLESVRHATNSSAAAMRGADASVVEVMNSVLDS